MFFGITPPIQKFKFKIQNCPMQTPWFRPLKTSPKAAVRLFCFPYAGGSSQIYHGWPQHLPSEIEVVAVELPGRGRRFREAPFTDLNRLVQDLMLALPAYFDKPFAFFGHSMGGLIAFELTHQMVGNLPQPLHLIVSGHEAPQNLPVRQPIHHLPEAQFIEEIRQFNGTPDELLESEEFRKLFLPVLRSDFTLLETYQYNAQKEHLNIPITVFGGLQDPNITYEDLRDWQSQTQKDCSVVLFAGDHFFLNSAQKEVLNTLSEVLCAEVVSGRSQQ